MDLTTRIARSRSYDAYRVLHALLRSRDHSATYALRADRLYARSQRERQRIERAGRTPR